MDVKTKTTKNIKTANNPYFDYILDNNIFFYLVWYK